MREATGKKRNNGRVHSSLECDVVHGKRSKSYFYIKMNVNKWWLHWFYPLYDFIYLFGFFVYWRLNTWDKDPTLGCSPSLCLNAHVSPFNFWCFFLKKELTCVINCQVFISQQRQLSLLIFLVPELIESGSSSHPASLWTLLAWCAFFPSFTFNSTEAFSVFVLF